MSDEHERYNDVEGEGNQYPSSVLTENRRLLNGLRKVQVCKNPGARDKGWVRPLQSPSRLVSEVTPWSSSGPVVRKE